MRTPRKYKPLTKEQQKLVQENHNLIYKWLTKNNLTAYADDWYGVLATGMVKAASSYNPEGGAKFSTYAWRAMSNEFSNECRSYNIHHSKTMTTLDSESKIFDKSGTVCLTFSDYLADDFDTDKNLFVKLTYEKVMNQISPRNREIINKLIFDSYNQEVLAKEYNCTRANISRVYRDFVKRFKNEYSKEN